MHDYALGHRSDVVIIRDLKSIVVHDRETTAMLLAHLAEVDARRLYAAAGYSSMFAYCVEELHFSGDAAYKRIQAARAGRKFPQLFVAIAEGRLHLTGAGLLSPHLTESNIDEFIAAATHRGKSEIEEWLAARVISNRPAPSTKSCIRPVPQLAPAQVDITSNELPFRDDGTQSTRTSTADYSAGVLAPAQVAGAGALGDPQLAPAQVVAASGPSSVIPEPRFLVQFTIDKETHDRLREMQALLSHAVSPSDIAGLFRRALEALAVDVNRKRLGSPRKAIHKSKPRRTSTAQALRTRYIPPRVRRAVWERDRGQCTFTSSAGHRCGARHFLEFDHVDPVARGGKATVESLRLRCRAHNQLEADRAFGAEFMNAKRASGRARHGRADAPARMNTASTRLGRKTGDLVRERVQTVARAQPESCEPTTSVLRDPDELASVVDDGTGGGVSLLKDEALPFGPYLLSVR